MAVELVRTFSEEKYSEAEKQSIDADRWEWVHFFRAYRLQAHNNFEEAIQEYLKCLRVKPDFIGVYNNIGNCYFGRGNYDEALRWYDDSIKSFPQAENAVVFVNRARALFALKEFDAAIASIIIGVERDPSYERAYRDFISASIQLVDIKRFNKAVALFKERLGAKDGFSADLALAYSQFATRLVDAGQREAAEDYVRQALALTPNEPGVALNAGYVRHRLGDLNEAITLYQRALRGPDTQALANYNLSGALARTGQSRLALDHLKQAITISPQYKETARTEDDFASIRDNEEFKRLVGA
jgi:tetratricopeptide (TPR) repeat protein